MQTIYALLILITYHGKVVTNTILFTSKKDCNVAQYRIKRISGVAGLHIHTLCLKTSDKHLVDISKLPGMSNTK